MAQAVVYDHLVDPGILACAPAGAELVDVGKKPGQSSRQAQINQLLVTLSGRFDRVVRLKGGDPFVFGRGGEEAAHLAEAGVAYEVVPGVTSAIAVPAYAGIPVTHRGASQGFVVLTGHQEQGGTPEYPWGVLAASGLTIVVLMGVAHRHHIAEALLGAGMAPATPVAAVMWGTTIRQREVRTNLGELSGLQVEAPAVLVIGKAAALDFERRHLPTLAGLRILVAGEDEPGAQLKKLLASRGAVVDCISPSGPRTPALGAGVALETALERIGSYDLLAIESASAIDAILSRLGDARRLAGTPLATIGEESARRFAELYLPSRPIDDLEMTDEFGSPSPPAKRRALLVHSGAIPPMQAESLRARGWDVDAIPHGFGYARHGALPDLVLFTSPDAVQGFMAAHGRDALPEHHGSIGPATSKAMDAFAITVDFEADPPEADGLVRACERWRAGPPPDCRLPAPG